MAPPAAQETIAQGHPHFTGQTGNTQAGAPAFVWQPVVISKRGNLVNWTMNGVLIASLNTSTQFGAPLGGSNIFFGQSDINATVSAPRRSPRACCSG